MGYTAPAQESISDSLNTVGNNYFLQSEYVKSNEIFYGLLHKAREEKNIEALPTLHNRIGINYWKLGNYQEALEHFSEALKLDEKMGNDENIAMDLNNTGLVHWSLKEYNLALESYEAARQKLLGLGEEKAFGLGQINNNMGIIYKEQGKLGLAMIHARKAFALFSKVGDKKSQGNSYNNMGIIHKLRKQPDSAMFYFQKSLRLRQQILDKEGLAVSYNNIAEVQLDQGQPVTAQKNALLSLQISRDIQSKLRKTEALHTLSRVYEHLGQNDSALFYFRQYHEILDSIFSKEKSNQIAYYQAQMETAVKDLKIDNLEKERKLARLRTYYLVALAISIIAVLAIFLQRKVLNYRKDKKLADVKLQGARDIITIKENELKDYVLTISRKNKIIKTLKKQVRVNGTQQDKDELLKHRILTEQDWEEYKNRFTALYPGFFSSLKLSAIPFTEAEIRLLALIKLNLNGKEIASIIGISPQSVRVSKARLKKKLSSYHHEEINDFLESMA